MDRWGNRGKLGVCSNQELRLRLELRSRCYGADETAFAAIHSPVLRVMLRKDGAIGLAGAQLRTAESKQHLQVVNILYIASTEDSPIRQYGLHA